MFLTRTCCCKIARTERLLWCLARVGSPRQCASPNKTSCFLSLPLTYQFSSIHSLSCVRLFVTPWTAARQASLSVTNCWSLLKLMSIESVISSNYLILCRPLLLPPSIFPSIRVFFNKSALRIRWPKYWSFSFNISPSSEYSGLISHRTDWFDLLAVQGTLKSLLQHHSSKASIGKTTVLTTRTFPDQVMSLLF